MSDGPAGASAAPATLKAGALHWLQVSALGIAIAISGNVAGWNYGLGVGGWGGMFLAALAMALLFWCLTQSLAELAAALPDAGGFDGYVRRALGPTAAYLTGMSVAIALAVGAGLAISFGEAYVSAWLGVGGWPIKFALLVIVMGPQLRGASETAWLIRFGWASYKSGTPPGTGYMPINSRVVYAIPNSDPPPPNKSSGLGSP